MSHPAPADAHRSFALGVGLTNACNLRCAHCYRAPGDDALSVTEVLRAVEALPVRAVNFGTGENGLHPEFPEIAARLLDRGLAVTLTTNGQSSHVLGDALLARLSDVEFSIDYPEPSAHDRARGAGNWDLIEAEMARCRRLLVPVTVTSVLMASNARALPALARLAGERAALLRVNVYQPVRSDLETPSYEQFWGAFRALFEVADLVICGEPIVRAMLGLSPEPLAGCGGQTVRLTPRGAVVPCVYGDDDALGLADLERLGARVLEQPAFTRLRALPEPCGPCVHRETCHGGCPARRLRRGGLEAADSYCPLLRGEAGAITARLSPSSRPLPKAASACTTIVRYRGSASR